MKIPPRTRHVDVDGKPRYTNKLAGEASPYLRQHAHNPVEWWPWGPDAFAEAQRRDVPVFLSVGYATCHWCHVMEEESFEDEDIAAVMNANYVCIKMDREERPDVDALYMSAVQALTGHGGWPMSVWLTPDDKKPFYAGTYYPARDGDRGEQVGFRTVLLRLAQAWVGERTKIRESADAVYGELEAILRPAAPKDAPGLVAVDQLVSVCANRFDQQWGGLSPAPKFPSQTPLSVLLGHGARTGRREGPDMALHTLRRMVSGGIFDQIGGGFHRYSVDEKWLVPHFEKMLYDNALLVPSLLDAFQHTGDEDFAVAARQTLGWMDREMSDAVSGAFYAAQDADSPTPEGPREEGYFYTWTFDELREELAWHGVDDREQLLLCELWGARPAGNFEGRNIPWLKDSVGAVAKRHGLKKAVLEALVDRVRPLLYEARRERPAPFLDDKIIAAWNGLAISAFARAAFVFDDAGSLARAIRAWDGVKARLGRPDGRVWRTRSDDAVESGGPGVAGILDDHAFLCRAALDLFEASGEARFLDEALVLDDALREHFEDRDNGGFFVSANDAEALLNREKPDRDGAEPSGNSVHAENLMRLALLTDETARRDRGDRTIRAFGQILHRHPQALSEMWRAVALDEAGLEVAVVLPAISSLDLDDDGQQLMGVLRRRFIPHRVVVMAHEDSPLSQRLPLLKGRPAIDGKVTVYVCAGGACRLPVTSSRGLMEALDQELALGRRGASA